MAATLHSRTAYTVYTRATWSAEWTAFPYLQLLSIRQVAAPSVPQARFLWRAGMIKREDATAFAAVPQIDFGQHYVRVDVAGGPGGETPRTLFVGRFAEAQRSRGGNDAGAISADEEIVAYGLAAELEKVKIRSSVIDTGYTADAERTHQRIDTPIAFNEDLDRGFGRQGNRSADEFLVDPDEPDTRELDGEGNPIGPDPRTYAHVLAGRGAGALDPPAVWTAVEILRHVLLFHAQPAFLMRITGESDTLNALSAYKPPRLRVFGRTVKDVIDDLIDRRRGFGWCLEYSLVGLAEYIDLRVFTTVDTVVNFGLDGSVPANGSAAPIYLADDPEADPPATTQVPGLSDVRYVHDASSAYGTIIVQGEPILACCTFSFADGTLAKGWTDDLEVPYNTAADGDDAQRNDQVRSEDRYDAVYRVLRVPLDWAGQVKDGEGGGDAATAVPQATDTAGILTVDGASPAVGPLRNWGLRFCRSIPFRHEDSLGSTRPGFRDLLVLIKDSNDKYVNADSVGVKGIGHVGPIEHELGVKLGTAAGGNHVLGLNHFDAAPGGNARPSDIRPIYDYEEILVTASFRLDQRLRAVVNVAGNDPRHVLQIEVPDAELWYVAPQTILGVNADGTFLRHAGDSIIRDDGPRLRQVAAMAAAWYGRVRTPATFVSDLIVRDDPDASDTQRLRIGRYITSAVDAGGFTAVNNCITSIAWEFGERERTVIQTSFSELDMAPMPRRRKGSLS